MRREVAPLIHWGP